MMSILSYSSIFKPDTEVIIIFEENERYKDIKPFFDQYGYGFVSPSDNLIILDGEIFNDEDDIDEDVLRFIESHEIAHILLGHSKERNDDDEMDADLGAYILLKNHNLFNSIEILKYNFEDRHGQKFKKSLLDRVSDKIF